MTRDRSGSGAAWRRSRFCGTASTCVEVRIGDGEVGVRDGKDSGGPELRFTEAEWDAFVRGVRAGEFDV